MRKALVLAILALLMFAVSTSEAGVYGAGYPNGDDQVIQSSSSWDGYYHVVMTFNNEDSTASATVLNPSGIPSNAYGYNYFWADFFLTYYDFYGSNDGVNWFFITRYYY